MKKLDDTEAIEITDGIWWVGFADYEAGFSNNPYLLVDGEEAILFDPGPGHPLFRDLIMQKVEQVTDPEKIRYIVVHHQDPDLCGLIPFIENLLHPDLVIMTHPRASIFIPYYGVRKGVLPLGDADVLEMKSGRRIVFYHAPYLHFAGNIMSYDNATNSLFSGDVFAVFNREWNLYADDSYIELAKSFIEHYVDSKEPIQYAYDKIKTLKIDRILPQHGGIIENNINKFLQMLVEAEPGKLLEDLRNKPTPEQLEELTQAGKSWLKYWLKREIVAGSLDDLMRAATDEGPSTVSLLIEKITQRARDFGVANPLTFSQVHTWNNIWSVKTTQLIDSIRRRFLSRQYGISYGADSEIADVLQQGLQGFKTRLAVMFIDIRGFTDWSAERSPDDVVAMLSREHELFSRLINSSGGRVNKIMGDGLLAYFPEHKASDCLTTALTIQAAIPESKLLPVGIGCDYGEVIMGDLGQEARLDYTLIGATVNSAARMCASAAGGQVAASRRLFENLSDEAREAVSAKHDLKDIRVKIKPKDPEIEGILIS